MNRIASFDPDRLIVREEPAKPAVLHTIPREWEHGLVLLSDRARPPNADPDRWAQVIADAHRIATVYQDDVLAAGWSLENLFGFDPKGGEANFGLAVALHGRRLLQITTTEASIKTERGCDFHRPRLAIGAPLLWTFSERDLRP